MSYKFSVIIPIYNADDYLLNCLISILNSTYENIEIICVNDGSTDNSLDILYSFNDSRIKIIDKENGGVSTARNEGLKAATGDYITFVDADDYVHPKYFETFNYIAEKTSSDIILCSFSTVSNHNFSFHDFDYPDFALISDDFVNSKLLINYIVNHAFKREILNSIFFNERLSFHEDRLFNIQVLTSNQPNISVYKTSCNLYYYFQNPNSLMHSQYNTSKLRDYIIELKHLIEKDYNNSIYVTEIVKMTLSYRYSLTAYECSKQDIIWCKNIIRFIKNLIKKTKCLSKKTKIKYYLLTAFPIIYKSRIKFIKLKRKLKNKKAVD